jgi:hypothetical protein
MIRVMCALTVLGIGVGSAHAAAPPILGVPLDHPTSAINALWDGLANSDHAACLRAFWLLVDQGEDAARFIRRRLGEEAQAPRSKELVALIEQLDSDAFAEREKATKALENLGAKAETELRRVLATPGKSLESRRRVERLLERMRLPEFPAGVLSQRSLWGQALLEELSLDHAREAGRDQARLALSSALDALAASPLREWTYAGKPDDVARAIRDDQARIALVVMRLEDALANLRDARDSLQANSALRLRASCDFAETLLHERMNLYVHYNVVVGKLRKCDLPEQSKDVQCDWLILPAAAEATALGDLPAVVRKSYERLQAAYPRTPWGCLAAYRTGSRKLCVELRPLP